MFETYEEAEELNSLCAFCNKKKFSVLSIQIPVGLDYKDRFELERCTDLTCDIHCHWNHKPVELTIDTGNRDSVSIISGW